MLFTTVYLNYMSHGEAVPTRRPLAEFPTNIDGWSGKASRFDDDIYRVLGVDDSILMSYVDNENRSVQLYVGYYESQREGDLIHSPKNCMPGSGWNITSTSIENVLVGGKEIPVIKLILERGISKQVSLYWFQSRGRYISSEYWQKIYLVWDAISKNRTDGSFVRLISPVDSRGEEFASGYLKSFASKLIPILNDYLPMGS